MKAKYAITLIVLGFCLDLLGAVFTIMHRPHANTIFIIAVILKIVGAVVFFYKLTNYPRIKDFMES